MVNLCCDFWYQIKRAALCSRHLNGTFCLKKYQSEQNLSTKEHSVTEQVSPNIPTKLGNTDQQNIKESLFVDLRCKLFMLCSRRQDNFFDICFWIPHHGEMKFLKKLGTQKW